MRYRGTIWRWHLAGALISLLASPSLAEELEPRRWSHLPADTNFVAVGYAYTKANIVFDPVLLVENAKMEMHTSAVGYVHSFELFGKSTRIDVVQAYKNNQWTGSLDNVSTSITRSGLADTIARFAVDVYGAPPLAGSEYAAYRARTDSETVVGIALVTQIPIGDYMKDKLLNVGSNRFTFRPEMGVIHSRGAWSFEGTAGISFFTDNAEFFNGNTLEQAPLYGLQGHFIYTFRPGLWIAASGGYEHGGKSTVNGVEKDDLKQNVVWALSFGYPISPRWGIKFAYIDTHKTKIVGVDADTIAFGLSTFW